MPVREEDRCKTAFWGANRVLWEWQAVPFGLKNAPPYFQRPMDQVLHDQPSCRCYIDDIIIWSRTVEDATLEDSLRAATRGGPQGAPGQVLLWSGQYRLIGAPDFCQQAGAAGVQAGGSTGSAISNGHLHSKSSARTLILFPQVCASFQPHRLPFQFSDKNWTVPGSGARRKRQPTWS